MPCRIIIVIIVINLTFWIFPAQGLVRGVRRERTADLPVDVRPTVRQLLAMRARSVLRLGQTDQDLQTISTGVSKQFAHDPRRGPIANDAVLFTVQALARRDQLVAKRVRELGGQQEADRDVWPERAPELFR